MPPINFPIGINPARLMPTLLRTLDRLVAGEIKNENDRLCLVFTAGLQGATSCFEMVGFPSLLSNESRSGYRQLLSVYTPFLILKRYCYDG
jgi:hypothetical protein